MPRLSPHLEYEVSERTGERAVLSVRGRLETQWADEFNESLERHYVDDGVKEIVVDCSGLEEISLEGIAALLDLWQESKARGKRFVVEGVTGQVRQKLTVTGTLRPFEDPSI
jgi:anti-anti-sigma factor